MKTYTESFSENPLFAGLSDQEIEEILQATHNSRYEEGEIIFNEGDVSKSLYLMEEGSVEINKRIGDKNQLIARLHARTIFGEMALTTDDPRNASITALEPVLVHELSATDFNNMLQNRSLAASKMTINIARILTARMNHLLTEINKLTSDFEEPVLAETDLNTFKQQIFSDWSF